MRDPTKKKPSEQITDYILERMRGGVIPWRRPWGAQNIVSGRVYRGTNALGLSSTPFSSRYWLTFNQAKQLGGSVRRGEKARQIVLWTPRDKKGSQQTIDSRLSGSSEDGFYNERPGYLFNIEQTEGIQIPHELPVVDNDAISSKVSEWIANSRPNISESGSDAFYSSSHDRLHMPIRSIFHSQCDHFRTLFHIWIHWTGHPDRLARPSFGSIDFERDHFYTSEELVAEIGTAILSFHAGLPISIIQDTATYLAPWCEYLTEQPEILRYSASAAQKAADFIMGVDQSKDEDAA